MMKNMYAAMEVSELSGKLPYTDDVLKISNLNESLVIHIYFQVCDEQGDYFVVEIMEKSQGVTAMSIDRYDNGFEAVLEIFREYENILIPPGSFLSTGYCTHEQRIEG